MPRQGRVALAALSGLLLYAAFPPLDLGALAWVALAPLLVAVRDAPPPRAFRLGLLAGGVASLGIVAWMRVFGVVAWVLLAAYLGLFVGVFAWLWRWTAGGRSAHAALWAAPLLWTGLEYLRSVGVMGFPWALLGLTQYREPAVIQIASVTGVYGVSFAVALGSAVTATLIAVRDLRAVVGPLILLAAVIAWGGSRLPEPWRGDLTIAALQPNVPTRLKFDPGYAPEHMDRLARLTREAGRQGAALVVLPETALPYNLFGPAGVLREVGGWAGRARATLIASAMENGVSNIAVAVAPSGMAVSRYDKVRLVAFGESGVRPGSRHEPLWTPLGRVGVAICFESIFPDVSRALVQGGAEILAVITNDGWFDGTSGVAQHAAHAVLRAVESGRWVVRAANTGVTMLVDPRGRIRAALAPGTEGVLLGRAALEREMTPYARGGDRFAWLVLLGAAVIALPRLRPALAAAVREPAFRQAAAAALLPLVAAWLLIGLRPQGVWPGVLLAFVAVFATLRPAREWGFTLRGAPAALLTGLAVVLLLFAAMAAAYRAYAMPVALLPPPGGWVAGGIRQLVVAAAMEGWLRGILFAPLKEWRGRAAAVAAGTALGMLLQRGLGPEAIVWAMLTGAAFGTIRARTGNVLGLVIPHAVGNVLFAVVAAVR